MLFNRANQIPLATLILIGINVAMFAFELKVLGPNLLMGNVSANSFLSVGAMSDVTVRSGAWYQLITSQFVHLSVIHITMNMISLWIVGKDLEPLIGPVKFILYYLITGLAGNVLTMMMGNQSIVSAGASGAIFGLIGVLTALLLIHARRYGIVNAGAVAQSYISLIGLNLVNGFLTPGINNLAHIGGLIFGVLLGLI